MSTIASIEKEEAICALESEILSYTKGITTIHLYLDTIGHLVLAMLEIKRECRNQGIGTKVMHFLCAYADEHNLTIGLTPADRNKNSGTTSSARLYKFYSRFGFVRNKGRNKNYRTSNTMFRRPNE